jgi:hypothetical protein
MLKTTVGQFLVNEALPPPMRDYNRVYDKDGMNSVLEGLAKDHPDKYREVTKRLADIGGEVAFRQGGLTFNLDHLIRPESASQLAADISRQADQIYSDKKLSPEAKRKAVVDMLSSNREKMIEASFGAALKAKNPLAIQANMGFRGDKNSVTGQLGGDLLYSDYKGEPIAYPITRSFSQGLSPMEFMAATFGARTGVISLKLNTAEAGALNKQLTQAAHQVVVSGDQHEEDWHTGSQLRGLPVDTLDSANVGAVLSHDIGGYKKNTVLTPKAIRDLHQQGVDRILVRSPMVGGMADGGIHSRDAGVRNTPNLPVRNTYLGIEAGQAIGEPLSQLQMSAKHSGGVAGSSKIGGFKLIEALANPPKHMPFGATHAQLDGTVESIEPNPAGGHDVYVGGKKHYVNAGNPLKVQRGDTIEAGDVLSEGVPNPRDIIQHKGVGEGRYYLMKTLHDAYKENRISSKVLRRNLEPVVRGLVDHVVMTDFHGHHAPDDVVKYSNLEHNWQPRQGFVTKKPSQAVGKYLEEPVLHHTIGTKIRPSMLAEFDKFKVGPVMVHNDPPPFEPHMLRATENLQHDPDWQVRLGGQYLQRGLLDSAHRGLSSSTAGTSFIPGLIRGDNLTKMPKATP